MQYELNKCLLIQLNGMKKLIFVVATLLLMSGAAFAQDVNKKEAKKTAKMAKKEAKEMKKDADHMDKEASKDMAKTTKKAAKKAKKIAKDVEQ